MDWWFIVSKKKKLFLGWFIVALPTLLMLICKQVECLDIMSVMCIMMFNCAGSCWRWFMSMVHKVVFNMWMRRTVLAIARSTSIEPVVTFLGERSGAIRGLHQLGWRTWLIAASACNNDIVWDPPNAWPGFIYFISLGEADYYWVYHMNGLRWVEFLRSRIFHRLDGLVTSFQSCFYMLPVHWKLAAVQTSKETQIPQKSDHFGLLETCLPMFLPLMFYHCFIPHDPVVFECWQSNVAGKSTTLERWCSHIL